jgi:hypothetical protein
MEDRLYLEVLISSQNMEDAVNSVCMSVDGIWIVSGIWDKTVRIWS